MRWAKLIRYDTLLASPSPAEDNDVEDVVHGLGVSALRKLISDGLLDSDVFVLMLTDGLLTRPW